MAYTTTTSVSTDSMSSSQYLSSSHSSLSQSKRASSDISKTYKHASQLYLTRRLAEAHEALQPIINPSTKVDESIHDDRDSPSPSPAPIAIASTSQRIKIWSLYVTLLNAIVELGPEEGKQEFGSKFYNDIVRSVQSGQVWDEVVKDGYQGREGSVDAEVVYNLSNLLLAQAPDQSVNQSRLETYLSSSTSPSLDISAHLSNSLSGKRSYINGASTPKDLSSRIKILELFTLHVLPRNNEWEYARTFVNASDVLDEERREAFLQTLEELQVAKEQETGYTSVEEDYGQEPEMLDPMPMEETHGESEVHTTTSGINGVPSRHMKSERGDLSHHRTSSEVDYGIEEHTNGSAQASIKATPGHSTPNHDTLHKKSTPDLDPKSETTSSKAPKHQSSTPSRRPQQPPQPQPPSSSQKPVRKSPSKSTSSTSSTSIVQQARHLLLLIRTLTTNISSSLSRNPTVLYRTLIFVCAFLLLMSRRELRERVRRIVEKSWTKIKATAGMGVKVSYI